MQDFQERVVKEKDDVDTRLAALVNFFGTPTYGALRRFEQVALSRQLVAMTEYSSVLEERISAF